MSAYSGYLTSGFVYWGFERIVPFGVMILAALSFTISVSDLLHQIGLYSLPLIALLAILILYIAFTVLHEYYVTIRSKDYQVPNTPEVFKGKPVSIVIPVRNEPLEMVEETLRSVRKTKCHPLEIIVTSESDPEYHTPLIEVCNRNGAILVQGERSRVFNAEAIRRGLKQAEGELVGLLDSDYRVDPNWLKGTARFFEVESVDAVQCPQSYRNLNLPIVRIAEGFRAMLIHKNMARSIDESLTMSGTMALYRREVLKEFFTGNYVTEDFASSVRMILTGRRAFYFSQKLGWGLGPMRMADYATQQARWLDNLRIYRDYFREILRLKPRIKIVHLTYQSIQTLYHLAVSSLATVGLILLPISFRAGLAVLILYAAETLYKFGYAKLHSLSLKTADLSVWLLTDFVSAPYLLRELFRIFIGRPGVEVRTRKVV